MYKLDGKVALVTGAGGELGLGRGIALRLAQDGADVVVNDLTTAPNLETGWGGLNAVVTEIEALGRRALGVTADVSNSQQVKAMVDQAIEAFGQIDILVNNAGTPAARDRVPVVELDEADWDRVQRVNGKGTFLCAQAVARLMIARGEGGKIINMSSTSGKRGVPRFAAYCTSKFGVIGFSQSLAHELAPHRINVNAICPGLMLTERVDDMAAALKPDGTSTADYRQQMIESANRNTPLGRAGRASDVANMAAFLASSESDYLTGLALTVAGGSVMD